MASDLDAVSSRPSRRGPIGCCIAVLVVLLLAGAYTLACALAPVPAPTLAFAQEANGRTVTIGGEGIQAAVDAEAAGSAAGWAAGDEVWANDDQVRPIASISKLVTALVCLEAQPVEPGTDGPVHVWSAEDAARTAGYKELDGVAFDIPVGSEMTTRQMLQMMLLPSANDVAAAYAVSVFGSTDAFVAAAEDWRQRNGLESLRILEPTGMDEGNVASAADVVRLGRLAIANPLIAEITALRAADMPWGVGTVTNTNPLLTGDNTVVGLKTGRSSEAGYNLVAAQRLVRGERELFAISAALGRASDHARANDAEELLRALGSSATNTPLLQKDETVGTLTTADGVEIAITATAAASTTLLPGETASLAIEPAALGSEDAEAGAVAGTARLTGPAGEVVAEVPVVTASAIAEPGLWWRLTHPFVLFGG